MSSPLSSNHNLNQNRYAELLVRQGRSEEALPMLRAANSMWEGHDWSLKALLSIGKNHVFLGDVNKACDM